MKLKHNETNQIFNNEDEFRRAYSNTSFPVNLDGYALEYANVSIIREVEIPSITPTQRAEYTGLQLINNEWTETWQVLPLYDDPTQQTLYEEQFANEELTLKWNEVRNYRNILLNNCDWTQLIDSPLSTDQKTSWATYRQQLRDLPDNTIDIDNVTWPTPP